MCFPTSGRRRFDLPSLLYTLRYFRASSFSFSPCHQQTPPLRDSSHAIDIVDLGLQEANARITSFGRCRKIHEAWKLFEQMPHRDAVSYTSMIAICLKSGDLPKAANLFQHMPKRNVVAESAMINGYAKVGRIDAARRIFDGMPERNVFSWTSMISGYMRIGQVTEARALFDQMPVRNITSWTTMVLGYAWNGLILEAREIFDQIPEKNVVSWTMMVKVYMDNGRVDDARKLFDEMPYRNLYTWNTMLVGYLDKGQVAEAIKLFESMPQRSTISWTAMVTGLSRNGFTDSAWKFFDCMPHKDVAAWNAMITAYTDAGRMVEASELFNSMPKRNVVSWNALIDGYSRNGPQGEALRHLIHMLREADRPNETTHTSVLTACEGVMEVAQAHAQVMRLGFGSDTSLGNALITAYSRSGDLNAVQLAFKDHMAKDIVTWTAMILAYSTHGYGNHAIAMFAHMLRAGAKPDGVTFVGILSACSHTGLVQKGQRLFKAMNIAYGIEPRAEHYSCLVDLLGRAGHINEAKALVDEMPSDQRDSAVLGALLGACQVHRDKEVAGCIGEELIELEPDGSGGYVLLCNVYAAGGKWDDVARLRKKMKERKVKKVPGMSRIEVKKRNHVFYVGDRKHPEVKQIYAMLEEELLPQMKDMGYNYFPLNTTHQTPVQTYMKKKLQIANDVIT